MKILKLLMLCLLAGMISTPAVSAEETSSSEWEKTLEVYGWLPNIYITTATQHHVTLTLGELISNLKFMAMLDFGAQKNEWSFIADTIYLHVGGSSEKTTGIPFGNQAEVDVQVGIRAFISTFGGGYEFMNDGRNELHGLAGARYLYLKVPIEVDVSVTPGDKKVTWGGHNWDGVIGLKGKSTINEKWYANYYLDIGAGDSKFTWQTKVGFGYQFNKFTGTFGFRYLKWDFGNSSDLDNLTVIGPYIGARWTW